MQLGFRGEGCCFLYIRSFQGSCSAAGVLVIGRLSAGASNRFFLAALPALPPALNLSLGMQLSIFEKTLDFIVRILGLCPFRRLFFSAYEEGLSFLTIFFFRFHFCKLLILSGFYPLFFLFNLGVSPVFLRLPFSTHFFFFGLLHFLWWAANPTLPPFLRFQSVPTAVRSGGVPVFPPRRQVLVVFSHTRTRFPPLLPHRVSLDEGVYDCSESESRVITC